MYPQYLKAHSRVHPITGGSRDTRLAAILKRALPAASAAYLCGCVSTPCLALVSGSCPSVASGTQPVIGWTLNSILFIICIVSSAPAVAAPIPTSLSLKPKLFEDTTQPSERLHTLPQPVSGKAISLARSHETAPAFDVPVTYNSRIRHWINYFQTSGRKWFRIWLERSFKYLPEVQAKLSANGMPKDLAYLAMIESGFSSTAQSHAGAVGYWQFIEPTATRYGLRVDWWIDERQNFAKSTDAAIRYLKDLYKMFGSWYLVAAGYNTGENRVRKIIAQHNTRDFWKLAQLGALSQETINYVPKMIAAMLISKAPGLYGFTDLERETFKNYEIVKAPGGVDLFNLADRMDTDFNQLQNLNPELKKGIIPPDLREYPLRVPVGRAKTLGQYLTQNYVR